MVPFWMSMLIVTLAFLWSYYRLRRSILLAAFEVYLLFDRGLVPELCRNRHWKTSEIIEPHRCKILAIFFEIECVVVSSYRRLPFRLSCDIQSFVAVCIRFAIHFNLDQRRFRWPS